MGYLDSHHISRLPKRDHKEKNYYLCYTPLKTHQAELVILFSPQRGISAFHLPKSFPVVAGAWLVAVLYVLQETNSY